LPEIQRPRLLHPVLRRVDEPRHEREDQQARPEARARARLSARDRRLPGERPPEREERDEARDPVVDALGDLERLGLEEEHLLEVLLQPARALEVPLERRRRRRVGAEVPALLAVRDLGGERLRQCALGRRDGVGVRGGVARLGERAERALRAREHLEEAHAQVLVDETTLARHLFAVAFGRLRETGARLVGRLRGDADPQVQPADDLVERRARGHRAGVAAVAREAVVRARELVRVADGGAPERVDGDGLAAMALGRTVEARPRLEVVPRGVAREDVRGDVELDVDAIANDARGRERHRGGPFETGGVVHLHPDVEVSALRFFTPLGGGPVRRKLVAAQFRDCHQLVTVS
jgi:hypothetical protein